MSSFKDVPKVPLIFLLSAAKRSKKWNSMRQQIVGEETDSPLKIDKFATEYHPHSPYSRYNALKHRYIFVGYCRSVDDRDTGEVPLELKGQRVYSLSYSNAYYSEREDSPDHQIRDVWHKVDGIYQLIWG